jgi:phosphatidyl-myo-inositol alpha-mannosyltransferase
MAGAPAPMLRVGMVCPYSLSFPGGVQAQVLALSRQLRRTGLEVRVLAPCDGPPPETFVTPLGDSLPTAANGSMAPLAPDLSCALRTMRALRDEQFDVLHLHEPFAPGATMTAMLIHPAPIVATFHAAGESASYRYLNQPIKWSMPNIQHSAAVSKDAAELARQHLGGEYEILFNGVQIEDFDAAVARPTDGPTIFFLGRHEERKGLDVLLAALRQLPADVRLWIGSDGPDTARLRAEYAGDARIEWLGRLTDEDKLARIKGATVYCAPSLRGESFGVVLIEAMAAGTTIVASSLDGYRNVATDGVDAVLVEPGDVDQLAAALRAVLDDPDRRATLEAVGRRRAKQFSMVTLAELYAERYRKVIEMKAAVTPPSPSPVRRWISRMIS